MYEIDALGRQMLVDRPPLTRGRLSVFRDSTSQDNWFPHLNVSLKRTGSDQILWQWASHSLPIEEDGPPPYGEAVLLEKYFELDSPLKSPLGVEVVFALNEGATTRGFAEKFSAAIYLYPKSLDERGVQIGVIDFAQGLTAKNVPLFFRVNFPW